MPCTNEYMKEKEKKKKENMTIFKKCYGELFTAMNNYLHMHLMHTKSLKSDL